MPRGGNHPKHPKCPQCKKALYKTMEKGKASKKEDPFCYCHNDACELYGQVQEEPKQIEIKETLIEQQKKEKTTRETIEGLEMTNELVLVDYEKAILMCEHDNKFPWE